MKKTISILLLSSIMLLLNINAQQQNVVLTQQSSTVYICTGNYAKKYHSRSNCRGLSNCQKDIIAVSISKAREKGRSACSICY